jgi:serine protease Do
MFRFRIPLLAILLLVGGSARFAAAAADPVKAQELYERVTPSLVVVQFTYEGELGRRDVHGMGVVVGSDGLVVCSMGLTPIQVPDEQMRDFKVILPGDDEIELAATFEGRDERTGLTLVRVSEAREWVPIRFEDLPLVVGEPVMSIGLLPKEAGYKAYMSFPRVSATLRGPVPQVLVTPEGVTTIGSPVFNAAGRAVGFVNTQAGQSPLLDDTREPFGYVMNPGRFFTPSRDFLISLQDPAVAGQPQKLPSVGVASLTGLKKEVAEYFGLSNPAVQVGDVISNFPAARAGLRSGDVIVMMNGEPLERGDEVDETPQILTRRIARMKVGEEVKFSVLRGRDQPLQDIIVQLDERPMPANRAPRFWAEDLGFSTRQVVFEDTYARRLPADTTGALVALVKPGSSSHDKLRPGDLITRINQTEVESLEQFRERYEEYRKTHPRDAVVLEVLRGVNTQVIRIEPPQ